MGAIFSTQTVTVQHCLEQYVSRVNGAIDELQFQAACDLLNKPLSDHVRHILPEAQFEEFLQALQASINSGMLRATAISIIKNLDSYEVARFIYKNPEIIIELLEHINSTKWPMETRQATHIPLLKSLALCPSKFFKNTTHCNTLLTLLNVPLHDIVTCNNDTEKLGEGASGAVYQYTNSQAVKIFKNPRHVWREGLIYVALQSKQQHPFIIHLYGIALTGQLILEAGSRSLDRCRHHETSPATARFTFAWRTLGQILSALAYLTSYGLLHTDMKPDNLLLSKDGESVKLCDLGLTQEISKLDAQESCFGTFGTFIWAAPEIALNHLPPELYPAFALQLALRKQIGLNETIDCYALGLVMHYLLLNFSRYDATLIQLILDAEAAPADCDYRAHKAYIATLINQSAPRPKPHTTVAQSTVLAPQFKTYCDIMCGFLQPNVHNRLSLKDAQSILQTRHP